MLPIRLCVITFITQAILKYLQEPAAILGPQNRTQGRCGLKYLNVKAVVATFNQEMALVGAFSVITNLRMDLFEALQDIININI